MSEIIEPVLTIQEAKCLMEILDNDIPYWDKKKIAMLLLILVANPSLVKDGEEVVTSAFGRTARCYSSEEYGDGDYCSEYY